MELTGTIQKINVTEGQAILLLNEREFLNKLNDMIDDKLSISINKIKNKRSLDANSYCWILCDKIAKELSKEITQKNN